MASNTTLNAKNLEALGAGRLAELLIEISTGDAMLKRRLRMELAGAESPSELAKEVRKRLIAIAKSQSFILGNSVQAVVSDLETQRRAIVEKIAKADPRGRHSNFSGGSWLLLALSSGIVATTAERLSASSIMPAETSAMSP